jgi:hypothetical protein
MLSHLTGSPAKASGIEIGTSLGLSRATIGGDSPKGSSFTPRSSGSAALAVAFRVGDGIDLLLEPGYMVQGATVAVEVEDEEEKAEVMEVRLPYFALPLGVRVFSSGGHGFVVGGFDLRWMQNPEAEVLVGSGGVVDLADEISEFDVALNMGAGYAFSWRPVRVSLEARYSQGLINLDDGVADAVEAPFPKRFRTNSLGLILRLMVPLTGGSERS